ncbi:MerR family transcriptional regulator [Ornithinibacillus sp. BX22]|uniref:MerR family transcriptional regulator n=2 Tax=Ornithinibacillus TaxID=484508 RepID=A0A923L802_9BACI|nr:MULTISPECIES: MerR family transcriptional regulator [Ornithinibacillus]MBC5638158.1 MerR family transcriptional regulator [Ornithinibacillus hominis]MBS3680770.1 MerR family transcriptional regulator [Ornithinibacillus massiliensis]
MKNRFSIGEMAKLHNTTIKTLRYYDEIDLLKPVEIDKNNGYRYYSTEQFEQLNTIQYLKEIGFTLKEIKSHLYHRDIDDFLALLEKQKELTETKIKELERVQRRFQNRINDIKLARNIMELGVPTIKEVSERKVVRLMEKISSEPELELTLRQLENSANMKSSIFIGGVGLTVSINNVDDNKFDEYNSIFILIEEGDIESPLVKTFQKGMYACIYFRGEEFDSAPYYHILLQYIKDNGFRIIGDAIERSIVDHYISNNREDHLYEIQIPVSY